MSETFPATVISLLLMAKLWLEEQSEHGRVRSYP